jgi:integrase
MASIQTRLRANGTTAYRVMFRIDGKLVGESFDDPAGARTFKALVDKRGGVAAREIRNTRDTPGENVLMSEWVEQHINRLTGVTEGTRRGYRSIAAHHITPTLGDYPVDAITRRLLEVWVNDLTEQLAGKTLRNVHALLSATLTRAVQEGLIASNPAKSVRLPKSDHHRVEMVILTQNEFTALLAFIPEHWHPLALTMVGTGMRWGEVTALPVGACDLDADVPVVRVVQAWKHTGKSARTLGPPKTSKGRRSISLPPGLVVTLRPLVEGRKADQLVFTSTRGTVVDHAHFYERVWKPAVERANVAGALSKRPRLHDLRHTHATWMLAAGRPLTTVQRRLGHESIQTTVDVYGHALPDDLRGDAVAIELALTATVPAIEG